MDMNIDPTDQAKLASVPLRVSHPAKIPAKRYYDQAFFELEREHLWPHVWQMACRLEEIPNVGDYVEYVILDKSVLIVQTKTGVKAFHNACRHRGVQIAKDRGNCKSKGFICPFHGWRWNIDGENTFVFSREVFDAELLEHAEIDLVPCRVELWGGCAFINFDDAAPSLLDSMGPVTARMDMRKVEKLKMEWWCQTVLPTNWKLAMEAFMEGYHVMRTHPQLYAESTTEQNFYGADNSMPAAGGNQDTPKIFLDRLMRHYAKLSSGMGGMIHRDEVAIANEVYAEMELPEDIPTAAKNFMTKLREQITVQGKARGLDVPDLNALDGKVDFHAVEYFFPHYFLLPIFTAMASYRVRPLTAETCLFEIWSLAQLPDDETREPVLPKTVAYDSQDFPEIPRQDYSNLPIQQLGLHAKGFDYMRLSSQGEGLISNYQRLIDGYLAQLAPEKLAKATNVVNNGFDCPVLDIGF